MTRSVIDILETFAPREYDAWLFQNPDIMAQLRRQVTYYPAFALPDPDHPAAICGVIHAHGVGEAWLITGAGFRRAAPVIVQQLRQLCSDAVTVFGLHRLHMLVDSDREDAKYFAMKVGFEFECGPIKGLGADKRDRDFYLWKGDNR